MLRELPTAWCYDATHIRQLQHAHADQIESLYRSLAAQPGNPHRVQIRSFDATRTFLAAGERFTNRIILTGNESSEKLAAIFAYFDQHQAGCVLELNPANHYPTESFSWESAWIPRLLRHGCIPRHFRCVWQHELLPPPIPCAGAFCVRVFDVTQMDAYIALARRAEPEHDWTERAPYLRQSKVDPAWSHFVALCADRPIATAALFRTATIGYLAEAYTHPEHRRQGAHCALIRARLHAANEAGCTQVFAVTDSDTQSGRNLQRLGFRLAYNYLLFVRSPRSVRNA
ncbi:MAG: GNAT family N-acetyltransferase [Caldilineaceae bacterium]